jgi:hypothetical protein
MIHLLPFKYGGGQDYAFAPLLDSRAQKESAQVLLNRSRTDAELGSDLFIAAALDKQSKNLLVAAGNFDLIEVQHFLPFFLLKCRRLLQKHVLRQSFAIMSNPLSGNKCST